MLIWDYNPGLIHRITTFILFRMEYVTPRFTGSGFELQIILLSEQ